MAEFEFQPGDIISPMSGAFVKLLEPKAKGKFCDYCFQSGTLRHCGGCELMHYCGKKCQKRDWREAHEVECKSESFKNAASLEKAGAPGNFYLSRIILRILAKFHLHPDSFSKMHPVYDGTQRSFYDLVSHEETLANDPVYARCVQYMMTTFKYLDSSFGMVDFEQDFLQRVVGIWKTNMLEIMDGEQTQNIGAGLFIPDSIFDHSCRPNAALSQSLCQPGKLEIRCIHPIGKGEKPVISYLTENLTLDLEMRQAKLQNYLFTCTCEVCTAEKSGPLVDYNHDLLRVRERRLFRSHQTLIGFRERWLGLVRKVYHEYDPRITKGCLKVFYEVCQCRKVTKAFIRKEAVDMERRLSVTYGKDSIRYLKFQQKLNKLGIENGEKL